MMIVRSVLFAALAVLAHSTVALAFRNVAVGSPVPGLALEKPDAARIALPAPGRVTVVVFWRPGQAFSGEALADLTALWPAFAAKGVAGVAIAETGSAGAPPRVPFATVTDRDRQASDAFGVVVFPSTAVVDARGVLRAYLPSRSPNHAARVEAHVLRALGEITDAELTTRLIRAGDVHGRDAEAAQAALKRGIALVAEQKLEAAARDLAQALAVVPDLVEAQLQLGWVRLEMDDARDALRAFEAVLAKNPASPGARVGAGIARIRLGRVDEGIRELEDAVALNPEPVRAHYELGRAYEARGQVDRAVDHYRWAFLKLLQGRK